jgi:integrase
MIKIFDRARAATGIPQQDERGRTVGLHALRHTFGTHLSKNGVAPRTAQAAIRHSSLHLTMNVYTDPPLLDAAGLSRRCLICRCGEAQAGARAGGE